MSHRCYTIHKFIGLLFMRIGLLVFPSLTNTHSKESAASDLGQRLEPSILALASERMEDTNEFIVDNQPRNGIDLYLCSVYTRGWAEFIAFSEKVGRDKIIAGGYHPTARPLDTLAYARKVVTGLCGNIEEIIEASSGGVFVGKMQYRLMQRKLLDMRLMSQIYPDAMPGAQVGSSISSIGCPYDCDFCATPAMSGRKMSAYPIDIVEQDILDLKSYGTQVVFIRDESFITHPNFKDAVEAYGRANFEVLYSFGTAAALSEPKVRLLAENGWHSLCLGLEDVGVAYRKNKQLAEASQRCRDHNIGVTLSFIVNDDGKDKEAIKNNYRELTKAFFELKPIMTCANFFMPLPGTALGDKMADKVTPSMWAQFDSKTPLFAAPELTYLQRILSVAVQSNWYRSDEYAKLRNFECGDTLHLRMVELEKAFGLDKGLPLELQEFLN